MASCREDAAEWCGHGLCVEVEAAGDVASEWRCVCDSGWRSTYLSMQAPESEKPRCEIQIAVMEAFMVFLAGVSVLLLTIQVHAVWSGRLDKPRGFVLALSCVLNFCLAAVGLRVEGYDRVDPQTSRLYFPVAALAVTLYGVVATVMAIDKYLKVVRATAQGIKLVKDAKQSLTRETQSVIAISLAAWAVSCVPWFAAETSNRERWAILFALAGLTNIASALMTHLTISALDRDLRKFETEENNRAGDGGAVMANKLRRLRAKLARTHRSIMLPAAITVLLILSCFCVAVTTESTQRFDYSIQVWYVVYLGTIYGHVSHQRAQRRTRKASVVVAPETAVT